MKTMISEHKAIAQARDVLENIAYFIAGLCARTHAREVLDVKVEILNQVLSALNQELTNKDQIIKSI